MIEITEHATHIYAFSKDLNWGRKYSRDYTPTLQQMTKDKEESDLVRKRCAEVKALILEKQDKLEAFA